MTVQDLSKPLETERSTLYSQITRDCVLSILKERKMLG